MKRIQGRKVGWEKANTSCMIITSYFLGAMLGTFASDHILEYGYSKGRFTPLFTVFAIAMSILILMHFKLCERFCRNYKLENELIEHVRTTMLSNGTSARNTTLLDLQRMMASPESIKNEIEVEGVVEEDGGVGPSNKIGDTTMTIETLQASLNKFGLTVE